MLFYLAIALMAALALAEGPVVLTSSTFDTEVLNSGKNAFVKFYAPWCGHCKAAKPHWDKLGAEYAASASVLIGDVDCTVEEALCSKFDVKGYPTIKYWVNGEQKDYQGGRDYDAFKKFTADTLERKCLIDAQADCTPREKEFIEKTKGKDQAEITKQLDRLSPMLKGSMKPDLKAWVAQRVNILKQLKKE